MASSIEAHEWHRSLLHEVVPAIIRRWEARLGVRVRRYFLQRMKTRRGVCNHLAGHIRLNMELVKKPDLLEYIVVHETAHLSEPTHSERFTALLDRHYPTWRKPAPNSTSCLCRQSLGSNDGCYPRAAQSPRRLRKVTE